MRGSPTDPTKEVTADLGAYFRPRDLASQGVTFSELQKMVQAGKVERLKHGLYRMAEVEPDELDTIAMISRAIPTGIICLLSALSVHNIGTQVPHEIWIAIDRKARKPSRFPARVRIVRFSGQMLTYGVQRTTILGVPVRITSPARTVVDCFRYRFKTGIDVALEALRDAVRSGKTTADEILRAAEVCHARTVLRVYLEALQV